MQLERYQLRFDENKDVFRFDSIGPKEVIAKRIHFQLMDVNQEIYNLGFGDVDTLAGEINDTVVSSNGDTNKVLATVVKEAVEYFLNGILRLHYMPLEAQNPEQNYIKWELTSIS